MVKELFIIAINHSSLKRGNLCIQGRLLSLPRDPTHVSRSIGQFYRAETVRGFSSHSNNVHRFLSKPQTELCLNTVFQQLQ